MAAVHGQVSTPQYQEEISLAMEENKKPKREPMIAAIARLAGKKAAERPEPNRGTVEAPPEERRQDAEG